MWFAIHPLGGWITFAVLHSLAPLKVCPECAEKAKAAARRCPHCQQPFAP
jgi:predicted amidophosphoribosyltransferase